MRGPGRSIARFAAGGAMVAGLLVGGCVKRVHEVPGLGPGNPLSVSADMRLETFQVDEFEVRSFRIPLTGDNRRRYQFVVLKQGIKQLDYVVQQLEDDTWALLEVRSDGISIAIAAWPSEPDYATARSSVVGALRGGRGAEPCNTVS